MITPTIFNFYDYLKNPIADFCVSQYRNKNVLTLDDLMPEIQKLKHSKWALDNNLRSYIGDQLRLKLALENNDFLYIDADAYIPDLSIILKNKNCTDYADVKKINNGTFFYSDKNCRFNSYYFNIYNTMPKEYYYDCNYSIFNRFPFELDLENKKSGDMNLLDNVNPKHFLINIFYRFKKEFPNIDVIYYTKKTHTDERLVWQIENCPKYVAAMHDGNRNVWFFETLYQYIPQNDLISLFKEQLNFTYQKTLKFIEV